MEQYANTDNQMPPPGQQIPQPGPQHPGGPPAKIRISAKEFASKFKSKRECHHFVAVTLDAFVSNREYVI